MVDIRAIVRLARPVKHLILPPQKSDSHGPVPSTLCPLGISHITGVSCQPRRKVKEATVRNCILILISAVEKINLPLQTPIARIGVPSRGLLVKHRLCHRQPRRLILFRVRKVRLRRHHRRERPERLIVVSLRPGLVCRHQVAVYARLVQDGLLRNVIVGCVPGVGPVIDQCPKESTCFPPVVGVWEVSGYISCVISGVKTDEVPGELAGDVFDAVCW